MISQFLDWNIRQCINNINLALVPGIQIVRYFLRTERSAEIYNFINQKQSSGFYSLLNTEKWWTDTRNIWHLRGSTCWTFQHNNKWVNMSQHYKVCGKNWGTKSERWQLSDKTLVVGWWVGVEWSFYVRQLMRCHLLIRLGTTDSRNCNTHESYGTICSVVHQL